MSKKKLLQVSFSGGRTSGYMTKMLLDNYSDKYDFIVTFANTGQEHEKTLEFVHNCDVHFGFNTVWLEAAVDFTPRKGTKHKVVTYETASRNGEPYEDVIKKYGIPNKPFPHCTRETKLYPMNSYLKSLGLKKGDYDVAIGIRNDETRRVSKTAEARHVVYPLVDWFPSDKQDVLDWWEDQPFDLEIQEHQGNCTWCWKKSIKKHMLLMKESPEVFDFPARMEKEYPFTGAGSTSEPRKFFRGDKSTEDLRTMFKELDRGSIVIPINTLYENGGCSESCEVYAMEDEVTV